MKPFDGGQLVSATTQLKLRAPDGKLRIDVEDQRPRDVHERHRLFLLLRRRRMKGTCKNYLPVGCCINLFQNGTGSWLRLLPRIRRAAS